MTCYTVDAGCYAHLSYKRTFFHKRILPSWFYYSLLVHALKMHNRMLLLYRHIEQVLTHYLMIDELSATADSDSRTFSGAAMAEDYTYI